MRKEAELQAFLNNELDNQYLAQRGICGPNQHVLWKKHRERFVAVAPKLKRIDPSILKEIVEDCPEYLDIVFTRCLPPEVQISLVDLYPERIAEYLKTLQEHISEGRGVYLCEEAENLYYEIKDEYPELPDIPTFPRARKCACNTPFHDFFAEA